MKKVIKIQGYIIHIIKDDGIFKPRSSDVATISNLPFLKEYENSSKFFAFFVKGQYRATKKWLAYNSDLREIVAETSIIKFLAITLGCLLIYNDEEIRLKHFKLFKRYISGMTDNISKQLSDEVIIFLLLNEGFNLKQLNINSF